MEKDIMVTICCITYNQKRYIRQTIESFLMQKTNFEFEILIHDDASTDGTTEIIREYENKYPHIIKPIIQKENQYSKGIIPSQLLYKKATGKYITICEGDDYWTDCNKLQKQFDFMEKNKDYIATAHWCEVVNSLGEVSNEYNHKNRVFNFKKNVYTFNDYKKDEIPGHINTIMFRNIYKNSKYDYGQIYYASKLVGDRTAYLILSLKGDIYIMKEKMSAYRYVCDDNEKNYSSIIKGKNKSYEWYNYYNSLEENVDKIMNKKISLKRLKYYKFIESVFKYLKNPNTENKEIVKKIFSKLNKLDLVIYGPIVVIFKAKRKLSFKFSN